MGRCTTAAIITIHTPTFWSAPMLGGVTLALDMQYLNPAPTYVTLIFTKS